MNNDNIRKNSMYTAMFCDMVYILIVEKNFHANNYYYLLMSIILVRTSVYINNIMYY